MKSFLMASLSVVFSLVSLCAHADDFSNGVALYEQQNFPAAAAAFKKAAEQGKSDAQFNLGLMYLKGEGVAQNYVEAKALFEKAAAQNNVRAQVNLARMYAKAKGVAPNYGMAVFWFNKAVELGYADAQYSLGVLYVNGIGVSRDFDKAHDLFLKAAKQKNASAQYQLGLMYFKGKGVAIDKVAAMKWLILAGDYDDAVTYRSYAESQMSKGEIEDAKAQATQAQ